MKLTRRYIALTLVLSLACLTPSCDKQSLVSWSEKAVKGLEKALPTLESNGIDGAKVREAISIGNSLVAAFKANDNESAIGLTASMITAFEKIVVDTQRIKDPGTRTLILAILAVVDLALGYISDEMMGADASGVARGNRGMARARVSPAAAKIREYHGKTRWSCRNSQTGRYEKMSFCEKHPDVSQVETR